MPIERDELSTCFEGVRCDPDIVRGDWGAGFTERAGDAAETIGGRARDLNELDPWLAQEVVEGREIAIVTVAISKAEKELAHDNHRESDTFRTSHEVSDGAVALQ